MPRLRAEARQEKVLALREQGRSYREIGRELGISHELARRDVRNAGLTTLTVVPDGLGPRGQAFWDHAKSAFNVDVHEAELLTQVCRLLDRADALKAEVDEHGLMVVSSTGSRRPNPAIAEERQVSLAIGRLLAQLEIPGEDDDGPSLASPFSRRASKAAHRRWDNERARKAARDRWVGGDETS